MAGIMREYLARNALNFKISGGLISKKKWRIIVNGYTGVNGEQRNLPPS
jgi:hypothetical protein